jgi:hypothetical protein
LLASLCLGLLAIGSAVAPQATATTNATSGPGQFIEPMTQVTENPPAGYFSDPYPIHASTGVPRTFSGTTRQLLSCPGQLTAGCFQASPMSVSIGNALARQLAANGASLTARINNNIFQDDSGAWQMAVTYYVSNPKYPDATAWTAIMHAHPQQATGTAVPDAWVADSLLVGSFSAPTQANYDGKYFENNAELYLVYSKRLSNDPIHDGIVAQPMHSASSPDPVSPTVLLAPDDYNSELFGTNPQTGFRMIETGNITKVAGKYVMAYSAGLYSTDTYKAGLAWSDTFLPAKGGSYRKITMTDADGVWGAKGQPEVRYLLQSQKPDWPNYVGGTVRAPGVPAVVPDGDGWYLSFAGFDPADAPTDPTTGQYLPNYRRPYFAPLAVHIPPGASVAHASAAELATWITIGGSGQRR